MNYYGLSGKMTAQDDKQEELLNILIQAAALLEKNENCIHYIVSKPKDDPNAIWINEVWTSKEAHDASLEPADIKNLIMSALPILDMRPEQGAELEVIGGKGLTS